LSENLEVERVADLAHGLLLASTALVVIANAAFALGRRLLHALGDAPIQLVLLLFFFGGREWMVVTSHQADVRRSLEQGDVVGFNFLRLHLTRGVHPALLGSLEESVVAGDLPVLLVGFERPADDCARIRSLSGRNRNWSQREH